MLTIYSCGNPSPLRALNPMKYPKTRMAAWHWGRCIWKTLTVRVSTCRPKGAGMVAKNPMEAVVIGQKMAIPSYLGGSFDPNHPKSQRSYSTHVRKGFNQWSANSRLRWRFFCWLILLWSLSSDIKPGCSISGVLHDPSRSDGLVPFVLLQLFLILHLYLVRWPNWNNYMCCKPLKYQPILVVK